MIDNSTVTISNGSNSDGILDRNFDASILLKNDARVIAAGEGRGIFFGMDSGSLTVDGSILELQSGKGLDLGFPDDVSFTGANGGIIKLTQGAKIESVNGKMKDQGFVLTAEYVTVGASDAAPSTTGLTAGDYVWDGTHFTKSSGTPTATASLSAISGIALSAVSAAIIRRL